MSGGVSGAACQSGGEAARDGTLGQAGKLRASADSSLGHGACSQHRTPAGRAPPWLRLPGRHACRERAGRATRLHPAPAAGPRRGNVLGTAKSTRRGAGGVKNKQKRKQISWKLPESEAPCCSGKVAAGGTRVLVGPRSCSQPVPLPWGPVGGRLLRPRAHPRQIPPPRGLSAAGSMGRAMPAGTRSGQPPPARFAEPSSAAGWGRAATRRLSLLQAANELILASRRADPGITAIPAHP